MSRTSASARRAMVECQLRPNQVRDEAVLAAMGGIPREIFVPKALEGVAYIDADLPIAPGRALMEPRVLGRLLDAAQVTPSDLMLVLACGSGYEAAVAARLAGTVVAVEPDDALRAMAARALTELGADTVVLLPGDPAQGHARQAPYDVILICGAVREIPAAITAQLATGGRIAAIIRPETGPGRAVLHKSGATRTICDAATPLLPQFARAPGFVF